LSPIKQSRELYPLDATLDSKPQKQAVEMCFDRSLGNIQIPSDFRVVTSLKKQIDNLPLPWSHLAELFFHNHCHLTDAPRPPQVAKRSGPSAHLDSGLFGVSFCILAAKFGLSVLTKCENLESVVFSLENSHYQSYEGRSKT
jgi:hypothetical protein